MNKGTIVKVVKLTMRQSEDLLHETGKVLEISKQGVITVRLNRKVNGRRYYEFLEDELTAF